MLVEIRSTARICKLPQGHAELSRAKLLPTIEHSRGRDVF